MSAPTTTYIFLPELLYHFRQYIDENLDLPLHNNIPKPEIAYNPTYIRDNSIFELLFNNSFGSSFLDTTSDVTIDDVEVIDDLYVVTDYS